MIFAAQNKSWGNTEEATKFWRDLGIRHLMVKREENLPFIDQKGKFIKENFKRLSKLQKKYQVKYHLHPYDIVVNNHYVTSSTKEGQAVLKKFLVNLDKVIQQYQLYPLITLHLPRYAHPKFHFDFGEAAALKNADKFYQNLKLKSKLALETMHGPYRNGNHALLGYRASHFSKLIGNHIIGLCIDTGHVRLSNEPLKKYLDLPYPIYSVHLNGNIKTTDVHHLPTKNNVDDFQTVIKLLRQCQGPVVFEVINHGYTKKEIKKCLDFWKKVTRGS